MALRRCADDEPGVSTSTNQKTVPRIPKTDNRPRREVIYVRTPLPEIPVGVWILRVSKPVLDASVIENAQVVTRKLKLEAPASTSHDKLPVSASPCSQTPDQQCCSRRLNGHDARAHEPVEGLWHRMARLEFAPSLKCPLDRSCPAAHHDRVASQ